MASDWDNMYTSFSENKPIRRTTVKRSTTLPGSQPIDENNSPPTQLTRPFSSGKNIKTLDMSPSTTRKPYVNLACMALPDNTKQQNGDEEHLYENLPNLKPKKSSITYENWTPKIMGSKTTPTHNSLTPSVSLLSSKKQIPPPLIIKRHEMMGDQNEAERIGNQTDSFIVPNLTHYSQVSIGENLELVTETEGEEEEWIKQKAIIEEMGRALFNEEPSTKTSPKNGNITPKETESGRSCDSDELERRDTLTPNSVAKKPVDYSSDEDEDSPLPKIEKREDSRTRVEGRDVRSQSINYPETKSKLAQLTQLPQQRTDGAGEHSPLPNGSKSFSHHTSDGIKIKKYSRTMPKGYNKSQASHSLDYGHSELIKKLERQRQRVDRQMSMEDPDSSGPGKTHSTDESLLRRENSLSKFGIVEDKLGGTFIV